MTTESQEKAQVTLVSVGAAVVLTAVKLVVGLLTGSLGMLSEAAHSGLDLVASVITFFSVRIAERPADADHPYGHGRVENLSATLQGLLLLGTASFIIYESLLRIFVHSVPVETSVWTFVVMGSSIAIDFWRSRMLQAAAEKYHSKALEADALNFRADMYSSAVVIVGLALTYIGEYVGGMAWLEKADAVAALVVALMIMRMSGGLAFRAVNVMLDRAPQELADRMTRAVAAVPGVVRATPVRLRESGNRLFADVVVTAARTASLAEAHDLTERIESAVRAVEPRTETLVHVEPISTEMETAAERIRAISLRLGLSTHHEEVYRVDDHLEASLHLEVAPQLPLREAHALADRLVATLREDNTSLERVDTHIEVAVPAPVPRHLIRSGTEQRTTEILTIVHGLGVGGRCHEVRLYQTADDTWGAVLHCDFDPEMPMRDIHRLTERVEYALRQHFPDLEYVLVQAEPAGDGTRAPR
jgi:cation diffusion facilitator family transporter